MFNLWLVYIIISLLLSVRYDANHLFCLKRRYKLCNVHDVTNIFFSHPDYIPRLKQNEKHLHRRNGSQIDSSFQSPSLRVLLFVRMVWNLLSPYVVSPALFLLLLTHSI